MTGSGDALAGLREGAVALLGTLLEESAWKVGTRLLQEAPARIPA